jgi:hypothetical protein
MSTYLLLETGDKITIEDASGFILLNGEFITPHNLKVVDAESRIVKVKAEVRISEPSVN